MATIIRHGYHHKEWISHELTCDFCGTVFEAERKDLYTNLDKSTVFCDCPECKELVEISDYPDKFGELPHKDISIIPD